MKSLNVAYMPELDHLRFFAAMMITFFHLANGDLVHYLHFDTGVPLFFTLSGFLFFIIAASKSEGISYWRFVYNRFLRIYPMIIFLFLLSVVIMKNFTAIDFINLFGLNFAGSGKSAWWISDWGYEYLTFNWWTVGVEFTFYLIFPFLYKFYTEKGVKYLFSMVFLVVIFRYGLYYSKLDQYGWEKLSIDLNYSFFGNVDMFLVGMVGGHFYCTLRNNRLFLMLFGSKVLAAGYIALMWCFLVHFIDIFDPTSYPLVISSLCILLIIFYLTAFSSMRGMASSRLLARLGGMSFSIYLLHAFIRDALRGIGVEEWFFTLFSSTGDSGGAP